MARKDVLTNRWIRGSSHRMLRALVKLDGRPADRYELARLAEVNDEYGYQTLRRLLLKGYALQKQNGKEFAYVVTAAGRAYHVAKRGESVQRQIDARAAKRAENRILEERLRHVERQRRMGVPSDQIGKVFEPAAVAPSFT